MPRRSQGQKSQGDVQELRQVAKALVAVTAVFLMGPRGADRFRSLTHSECGIPQGSSPLVLVGDYQNENCGTWVPGQNYFDCVVGRYGYDRVGLARVTGRTISSFKNTS